MEVVLLWHPSRRWKRWGKVQDHVVLLVLRAAGEMKRKKRSLYVQVPLKKCLDKIKTCSRMSCPGKVI